MIASRYVPRKATLLFLLVILASVYLVAAGCAPAPTPPPPPPTSAPAATAAPAATSAPAATAAPAATSAPAATTAPAATSAPAATTAPTSAAGAPKRGGTVTMVAWQEPEHLNWELGTQTILSDVADFWAEGLLSTNEKGEFFPVLATEVPTTKNGGVSADGKTITYKLRKGVKWHDGADFTCEDLQFTLKVITTPGNSALHTSIFQDMDKVECPDPNTAVLKFKNFYAAWLTLFNGNYLAYIFPKNA